MMQVYNSQSVPSDVKRQVANWKGAKRASTGYACFEFASPADDILVFSENGQVTGTALLCASQGDTDAYGIDMLYLAYFATAKRNIGKLVLKSILEYAHQAGFEISLIALPTSIGFYEKCEFLYKVGEAGFSSV